MTKTLKLLISALIITALVSCEGEKMKRELLSTEAAPAPVGAYSQGSRWGELIFTAGQIPLDPKTGELIVDDFAKAAELSLQNMLAVVEAGGGSAESILKITVFLKDLNNFALVNAAFEKVFPENPPARSAVEVSRLPKDVPVEMECIAIRCEK
jgi:2-iminobutanoate/2-iminopropanoate deaminase